ncbi:MAG: hypothetical protein ABUT20_37145, partial [Bacteroidota bacterium]
KFFNAYNAAHQGTENVFYMDTPDNVGHGGWDQVMAYNGQLHNWITIQFGPEEPNNDYSKGYLDGLNKAKVSIDSLININLAK